MSHMYESLLPDGRGPARAQAIALDELTPGREQGEPLVQDTHPLHGLKVQLEVCVGRARLTLGELLAARANEVLLLDRQLEQPVDLLLDGKVVARGQLVAVDDAFAVRITELPIPLGL
jgi:flagellar motor switch protein FliN/FliY